MLSNMKKPKQPWHVQNIGSQRISEIKKYVSSDSLQSLVLLAIPVGLHSSESNWNLSGRPKV